MKHNDIVAKEMSYQFYFLRTVFLDYGPEWEAAWNEYVKEWSPPPNSEGYIPASMIGEPLRTESEQLTEPYPDNIVFYCHFDYMPGDEEGPWEWEDEWEELILHPCRVVSRDDSDVTEYLYTMVLLNEDEIGDNILLPLVNTPVGSKYLLTGVPRWAIEVRDKMYTKDEFMKNAFRHEMMLPDDVFPETWKNLLEQ